MAEARHYHAEYNTAVAAGDIAKAQALLLERADAIDADEDGKGQYKGDTLYNAALALRNQQQPAAPTPTAPALPQYQDQSSRLQSSYEQQLAAQVAKINATRDQAISGYQGQIEATPQEFGEKKVGVDASVARGLQKQNEIAAAKGTAFSGGVSSDMGAIRGMGEQSKVALTQQEMNLVQNLKRAIAETKTAASYEQIAATANSTSQMNQALAGEAQNVYRAQYQTAQDTFGNQVTSQNQSLNVRTTEAQLKQIDTQIKQSDAATAGQLLQNEMAKIQADAAKDPNSPENQAKLLAIQQAEEELRQLMVAGKYTESEAKARVESIWANIRQSNASAASSYASAERTTQATTLDQREFELKRTQALQAAGDSDPKKATVNSAVNQLEGFFSTEIDTVNGVMDPNQPKAKAKAAEWLRANRAEIIANSDIATFNSLMSLYGQ